MYTKFERLPLSIASNMADMLGRCCVLPFRNIFREFGSAEGSESYIDLKATIIVAFRVAANGHRVTACFLGCELVLVRRRVLVVGLCKQPAPAIHCGTTNILASPQIWRILAKSFRTSEGWTRRMEK